LYELLGNPIT